MAIPSDSITEMSALDMPESTVRPSGQWVRLIARRLPTLRSLINPGPARSLVIKACGGGAIPPVGVASNGELDLMNRPYETTGQHLAWYIEAHHLGLGGDERAVLENFLAATSNGSLWTDAFHAMAVLHCERRLIAGGKVVCKQYPDLDEPLADRELGWLILDTMNIDFHSVPALRERLKPAIQAARSRISPATRRAVRGWAERVFPRCYLCSSTIDFSDDGGWTLDHVWPQAYGGDSEEENLLPACRKCNEDKGDKADWAIYPIQGMVAGHRLDSAEVDSLPGQLRYAVIAYHVARMARIDGLSLRDAYIKSTPFSALTVVDRDRPVDIFNLELAS
jgi:hypothetical protein